VILERRRALVGLPSHFPDPEKKAAQDEQEEPLLAGGESAEGSPGAVEPCSELTDADAPEPLLQEDLFQAVENVLFALGIGLAGDRTGSCPHFP
jgi:hypothetical protein